MPDPAIFIAKSSMMKLYKIYEILRACTLVAPRFSTSFSGQLLERISAFTEIPQNT